MTHPHQTEIGRRLAKTFHASIRSSLTGAQLEEADRKNDATRRAGETSCRTHDYMDANVNMIEAFTDVFERAPFEDDEGNDLSEDDPRHDTDTEMLNAAWTIASEAGFNRSWVAGAEDWFQLLWAKQFPHFGNIWQGVAEGAEAWLVAKGFADNSWHNDAMPSYVMEPHRGDRGFCLWVNPVDKNAREMFADARFVLAAHEDGVAGETILATEDWALMQAKIDGLTS